MRWERISIILRPYPVACATGAAILTAIAVIFRAYVQLYAVFMLLPISGITFSVKWYANWRMIHPVISQPYRTTNFFAILLVLSTTLSAGLLGAATERWLSMQIEDSTTFTLIVVGVLLLVNAFACYNNFSDHLSLVLSEERREPAGS